MPPHTSTRGYGHPGYPLIGARVHAYMHVNGRISSTNFRWLFLGLYWDLEQTG
jgi:hypothetical protein